MSDGVGARLANLRAEIDAELQACGREPGSVRLVGVSKFHPAPIVAEAIEAGLTDIGENYVQEAQAKLRLLPPVTAHFIGHIQTNKAKALASAFDLVQSVDRVDAAVALDKAARALGKRLPVLIQLNISPVDRFGCPPDEAQALAERIHALEGLRLDGLMAIGPVTEDSDEIARAFELAAKTLGHIGGSTLSIGMSGDWRAAVRAGSTMVRLGTALFGGRTPR
jgi:pyridoxal phosphate enzyme (YggS family)